MKEKKNMQCKLCGWRTGLPVSERALGTGMFGNVWGYDAEPDEGRSILQSSVEVGAPASLLPIALSMASSRR